LPIKIFPKQKYTEKIIESKKIIEESDKKDVDILALSLKENCLLWSEDKHFRDKKNINLIRTKDLL